MPTAPTSSLEFVDLLKKSGLLAPEKLEALSDLGLPEEPHKAASTLVAQGILTRFQAQQLLAGRHKGFRIGAYVIQDMLGRGGMGAVYLAEHLDLNRKVAIKVLVPGRDDDQKLALERFIREARSAAALDHPNIVRIFDVARHNDVPYLVMEYVEGETLQQALDRDGAIPYPTATEYVAQAAAGLQHAHEKGFVHRDIKPGNLMREKNGTIKILDMGLARSADPADSVTERLDNGAVVGTADFIAPEQALNQPNVDGRADIYSLGATFFALLIGKPPFEGNTTQKLLQHQLRSAPRIAALDATLPKGLSAVVAKMLAKKPEDRYQTPAEVIAALAPWMGNRSRILAGISRTNLAQGADLQATLSEIVQGSPQRLRGGNGNADDDDTGRVEVEVDESGRETGAMASAITTRERIPARAVAEAARNRTLIYAIVAVGVSLIGVLAAWATTEWSKKPVDQPGRETLPNPKLEQLPNPKLDQLKPAPVNFQTLDLLPPADRTGEQVLYQLNLSGQKPFAIVSGLTVDPNDPNRKTARPISRTGSGQPPVGWSARCYNLDTEMEFSAIDENGKPALGIRNLRGPGSAMLFLPRFSCPTSACRLRIEYSTNVRDGRFSIRFKAADNRPAWDIVKPPVTNGTWRSEELECDLKGAQGGFFELHNSDTNPDAYVRVRAVTLTERSGTLTRSAVISEPDLSSWIEGKVLYTLNVAQIPEFRVVKEKATRTSGEPERLPTGVGCQCWKENAVGEFRCETTEGGAALGVTNLNDAKSGQFYFDLEGQLNLPLEPGKAYRVKLDYLMRNEAVGDLLVHVTPGYRPIASARLTNTSGAWRIATATFTRPPAGDNVKVRMVIDNTTVGEGNTLLFRSVEIVELYPPLAKK